MVKTEKWLCLIVATLFLLAGVPIKLYCCGISGRQIAQGAYP